MDNKEFGRMLEARTIEFALGIIKESDGTVLTSLITEAHELLAIFASAGKNLTNQNSSHSSHFSHSETL
jgi:hypothetical protein